MGNKLKTLSDEEMARMAQVFVASGFMDEMVGQYYVGNDDAGYPDQEDFEPENPMETSIRDFLDGTKENYVCVSMLYYEALGHSKVFDIPKQGEARLIANILDNIPGWNRISTHNFWNYGKQRGWVREGTPPEIEDPDGFVPVTEAMGCPFT